MLISWYLQGSILGLSSSFSGTTRFSSLVKSFVQGVIQIISPVYSPVTLLDINLVPSVLQKPPFEPIWDILCLSLLARLPSSLPLSLSFRVGILNQ